VYKRQPLIQLVNIYLRILTLNNLSKFKA